MKQTKKKRRSRAKKPNNKDVVAGGDGNGEESRVINALMEAFSLTTLEEAASAYRDANGDVNKAAEILGAMLLDSSEDPSASSSTTDYPSTSSSMTGSSGVGSSSSEGLMDVNGVSGKGFSRGNKGKKVVAATGTVSTVLGKDYVIASPRRDSMKSKGFGHGHVDKEETEQFLCSMLGDECELSMAVVRDVLCK